MQKPIFEEPKPVEIFSLNAEYNVLAACLHNPEVLERLDFLQPKDFYYTTHQKLFETALRLKQEGRALTMLNLAPNIADNLPELELEEVKQYLCKIYTGPAWIGDFMANARHIADYARKREIVDFLENIKNRILLEENSSHAANMINFSDKLLELDNQAGFMKGSDTSAIIEGDLKKDSRPVSTGFYTLNECTDGGFYFGKSYAFSARKKVGKTLLGATLAYNLAIQNVKTLFIACEMNPEEIHQRILCRVGGFYQSAFRSGYAQSEDFQQKFTKSLQWNQENILYKKAAGITFEKLKMYVNIAIKKDKVRAIILDYWQLIGCSDKRKNTAEHLDEVAQWLADTGRKFNVIIISMAQINQTGNTRGGEGIRLAFDQVYQIHREDLKSGNAWVEMLDTRYTKWLDIGSPECAGWRIGEFGTYFEEM